MPAGPLGVASAVHAPSSGCGIGPKHGTGLEGTGLEGGEFERTRLAEPALEDSDDPESPADPARLDLGGRNPSGLPIGSQDFGIAAPLAGAWLGKRASPAPKPPLPDREAGRVPRLVRLRMQQESARCLARANLRPGQNAHPGQSVIPKPSGKSHSRRGQAAFLIDFASCSPRVCLVDLTGIVNRLQQAKACRGGPPCPSSLWQAR